MARELWLLRHGEAEPHGATADDARRLTERGSGQARAAGRALASRELTFQYVFTSPKVRAAETARLACEALGVEPVVHRPLRSGFDHDDAVALLHAAGADHRVLVVGHEPDLSRTVRDLTGAEIALRKGGIAGVRMQGSATGELVVLLRPRELDRICGIPTREGA